MSQTFYLGRKIKEKDFVKAKSNIMEPDEELMCVIKGGLTKGGRKKGERVHTIPGMMFLTNKRVIVYSKGFYGGYEQVVFPYEHINSILGKAGVIGDKIDIKAISDAVTFDYVPKGDGKIVVDKINEMIREVKTKQTMVQPAPQKIDIADQIEKLASLKDKGILSEEEFEKKKAELLQKL